MLVTTLIVIGLLSMSASAPSGTECRTQDEEGNDPKRAKTDVNQTDEVPTCLYQGGRKSVEGKIVRSSFAEISATCSGAFTRLADLATKADYLGTDVRLQLLLARGSAVFSKDFNNPEVVEEYANQFICDHHLEELMKKWGDFRAFHHFFRSADGTPKCSYPDDYHGESRPSTRKLNAPSSSVTFEEAKAVMSLEKILLPIGLPVCTYHKQKLKETVAKMANTEQPPSPTGGSLRSGTDHHATVGSPSMATVDPKIVTSFRAFAASAGEDRLTGWLPLSKVDRRTLQKKTCAARRLIDVFFQVIAKDDSKAFAERVMSPSASYNDVMAIVTERFYNSTGRREKEVALALIAKAVPLRELRLFIPGLSERMYYRARSISLAGIKADQEKFIRLRFNPSKLAYFIEFLTSPLIMTDIPFGDKKVTASDGRKYTIHNSLRNHRASEIVFLYTNWMNERGLGDFLFSRSTLFKIMSFCSATERKASAFGDLSSLVIFLHGKKAVSKEWKDEMDMKIKEVRFYLKGDYRSHTRNHSRISDHCWSHALSDPTNPKLSAKCDNKVPGESHSHDLKCDRCELGKSVMVDLTDALDEYEKEVEKKPVDDEQKKLKEDIDDWKAKLQQAKERIEDYKMHQLRSAYSYKVREQMVEESEEDVASVILDFGQKWLASKHLEAQSEYFGKKGMSYHVTHIQTKKSGRIAQHLLYHVINTDQQDSVAVVQLIGHVLGELKKVGIKSVHLRSDNAGCYHSAFTILAVEQLAADTGVRVISYGFSESQAGKSAADRGSGLIKNKVRANVNAGGDATTHEKFFTAATSGRLIEGASVYLVSTKLTKAPAVKIDKVSEYYDFLYEKDGVRMFRHRNIGEGVFLPSTVYKQKLTSLPSLTVVKSGGHLPESGPSFWKISPAPADGGTCPKDDLPSLVGLSERKPFYCPEISCTASFDTADELEVHWLMGLHCQSPMTATLRDESLKMFSAGLENSLAQRLDFPDVDDAIHELEQSEFDDDANLEAGWALKKRKAVVRFTEKAKKYIEKLFDEGITLKKKIPPEEAENRMASERKNGVRVFSVEERLNARQIASLYSRIAAGREQQAAATTPVPATTQTAATTTKRTRTTKPAFRFMRDVKVDQGDEEEIDENGIFEDPWYYDQQDLVVLRIMEARHEIFDIGQPTEVDHDEILKENSIPLRTETRTRRHHRHHRHHRDNLRYIHDAL